MLWHLQHVTDIKGKSIARNKNFWQKLRVGALCCCLRVGWERKEEMMPLTGRTLGVGCVSTNAFCSSRACAHGCTGWAGPCVSSDAVVWCSSLPAIGWYWSFHRPIMRAHLQSQFKIHLKKREKAHEDNHVITYAMHIQAHFIICKKIKLFE